jgi:hypothetical protein
MRRGYTRERRGLAPDEQRKSLKASGIDLGVDHPAIYEDVFDRRGKPGPLSQRALAIKSLREGDELVVHDAATLGKDLEDISKAMVEIGRRGATLIVWTPTQREYEWHPDAAEIVALANEAAAVLLSEKHRRAGAKKAHLGAQPKLVGDVLNVARQAWADPALTANQAADVVRQHYRIKVSTRTLWTHLGKKSDAETAISEPIKVAVVKAKPKPKRRKARRVTTAKRTENANA